jgi:protein-S-isoprenylcysteine O-methyltransferase Ste14
MEVEGRKAGLAARRVMPPVYFYGAVAAMGLLHLLLPGAVWLAGWWRLLGLLPLAAGTALAVAGSQLFQRVGTTIRPFERSAALVTVGVFALSRNPMYLGMVLGLGGIAVLLGTVTPLLVVPLFVWLIQARFIAVEERMLSERFGAAYEAYRGRTRRWL